MISWMTAEKLTALNKLAGDAALGRTHRRSEAQQQVRARAHLKQTDRVRVDPDALFDVHIKRIHEYQAAVAQLIETVALYDQIRSHPERDWVRA